jgi:3-oxoacyl-[acyl-carrier-protein] synthase II
MRRVAVTGTGILTALGGDSRETWTRLVAGQSAIGPITAFDPSALPSRLGAEITTFDPTAFADRRALKLMTRNDQFAVAGATLAVRDAGLEPGDLASDRAAVFVGGNKEISNTDRVSDGALAGRMPDGRVDLQWLGRTASSNFHPLFYVEALQGAALFHISNAFGVRGPNCYFVGTADAGATAIGRAFRAVARGEADVAIAGGFDDATSCWAMAKINALGVLSTRNDRGQGAFRPYDRERSGSIVGEGAAFVVLEALETSRRRGAVVHAEITGFGSAFDTESTLTPRPDGRPVAQAVGAALREAELGPDDVDYVASHGCATTLGDASEAAGLRAVFASRRRRVLGSSVKPATGHLVAGAGALNVAVAALAIRHGTVPPTLNLTDPDPACAHDVVDWVPGEARPAAVRHAVAVARGLEGQNVAVALSRGPAEGRP